MSILKRDEDGDIMVRENLILCLFAKLAPVALGQAIEAMFDRWLALLPAGVQQYAMIGASASSYRKVDKKTRGRLAAELDQANLARRDLAYVRWQAPIEIGPDWRFLAELSERAADPEQTRTNLVEMLFPPDLVQQIGAEVFIREMVSLASLIPFDTGYVAPALMWCSEETQAEAGEIIGPAALRHPGYDVCENQTTAYRLGRRSRGARWLTFLGASPLEALGGAGAIRGKLPAAIDVQPAGSGIVMIAGAAPDRGDVNRRQNLPALREVASIIEPVTYFGDRDIDVLFADDADLRARWERRLLD